MCKKCGNEVLCKDLCRTCYDQERYQSEKDMRMERNTRRRLNLRAWLNEYKEDLVCWMCGFDDPRALDFHHVRGEKKFAIANMISRGNSIETVLREIKKCIVLCANCHRLEHAT